MCEVDLQAVRTPHPSCRCSRCPPCLGTAAPAHGAWWQVAFPGSPLEGGCVHYPCTGTPRLYLLSPCRPGAHLLGVKGGGRRRRWYPHSAVDPLILSTGEVRRPPLWSSASPTRPCFPRLMPHSQMQSGLPASPEDPGPGSWSCGANKRD